MKNRNELQYNYNYRSDFVQSVVVFQFLDSSFLFENSSISTRQAL